jgi:hypothetical protein
MAEAMPAFDFTVRGHKPKAYSTYEEEWKTQLAAAARRSVAIAGIALPRIETPVRVRAVFYLLDATLMRTDVDNLAKPLLDVLFRASTQRPESQTGALFPFDDRYVTHLSLEKRRAADDAGEGCDVSVEW